MGVILSVDGFVYLILNKSSPEFINGKLVTFLLHSFNTTLPALMVSVKFACVVVTNQGFQNEVRRVFRPLPGLCSIEV